MKGLFSVLVKVNASGLIDVLTYRFSLSKTVLDLTKFRIELRLQFATLQGIAFEILSIPL